MKDQTRLTPEKCECNEGVWQWPVVVLNITWNLFMGSVPRAAECRGRRNLDWRQFVKFCLAIGLLLFCSRPVAQAQTCAGISIASIVESTNRVKCDNLTEFTNTPGDPVLHCYLRKDIVTAKDYNDTWSGTLDAGNYSDGFPEVSGWSQFWESGPGAHLYAGTYTATQTVVVDPLSLCLISNIYSGSDFIVSSNFDGRFQGKDWSNWEADSWYWRASNIFSCSISFNTLTTHDGWSGSEFIYSQTYFLENYYHVDGEYSYFTNEWRNITNTYFYTNADWTVLIANTLVQQTPTIRVYEDDPPPTNGSFITTITLTNEYTTVYLKQLTAGDLQILSLGDTNKTFGSGGQAAMELSTNETDLTLAKARFVFSSTDPLETNKTYVVEKKFTVNTYQTNVVATLVITNLIGGNGKVYYETNDIIPVEKNGGIVFQVNGVDLCGEVAHSTQVGLTEASITEYQPSGCNSCRSPGPGPGGGGPPGPGYGGPILSSIKHQMSLGKTAHGQAVGEIYLYAEQPTAALATPEGLGLLALTNLTTVVRDGQTGWMRQVGASQCLADIVQLSPYEYQVNFYATNALIANHDGVSLIPTNGLSSIVTWNIRNPDGSATNNRLQVTEIHGSSAITNMFTWDSNSQTLYFDAGNGLRRESLAKVWNEDHTIRTETRQTIEPTSTQVVAQTVSVFQNFAFGEEIVQEIIGSGTETLTNTYTYWDDALGNARRGKIKLVTHSDGGWEYTDYDSQGRISERKSPFINEGPDNYYSGNASYYYYGSGYVGADDPSIRPNHPRYISESRNGLGISEFFYATNDMTVEIQNAENYQAASTNYSNPADGRLMRVDSSDGFTQFYYYGTDSLRPTNVVLTGKPDAGYTTILTGTKTETVYGEVGQVLSSSVYDVAPGRSDILVSKEEYNYTDPLKRSYEVTYLDGTTRSLQYGCCGIESEIDRDGVLTSYSYDDLKRLKTQSHYVSETNAITTTYYYDAAGHIVSKVRTGTDGSPIVLGGQAYDTAGRTLVETNALGGVTHHSRGYDAEGHPVATTIYPDGGTRYETYNRDGSVSNLTGTAVYPVIYDYEYGSTKVTELDTDGQPTDRWRRNYHDAMGRNLGSQTPSGRDTVYYDGPNRMYKRADADGVVTYYGYDERGAQDTVAVRASYSDSDDNIIYAGGDRITKTVSEVVYAPDLGSPVRRTQTFVWGVNGENTSNLLSTTETTVDGLRSRTITWNGNLAVTNSSSLAYVGNGTRYVTNSAPDGSCTVATFVYGLLQSTIRYANGVQLAGTTHSYDTHGRLKQVVDVRNGATSYVYNNADQVVKVTTPPPGNGLAPQNTTTDYDTSLRPWRVTQPDGTMVYTEYYPNGLTKKVYGSRTYPVSYGYDTHGRMTSMTNWSSYQTLSGSRVTSWIYNTDGRLAEKLYDGEAEGITYQYWASGRLKYRYAAGGKTTYYNYNRAGDPQSISYVDTGSEVNYEYDRRGRSTMARIAENNPWGQDLETTLFAYDDLNNVLTELHTNGILCGIVVSNSYDSSFRRNGTTVLSSNQAVLFSTSFSYDGASRLTNVMDTVNNSSATYAYLANSPLVSQIAFKQGGTTRMTTAKAYDYLNRLTQISSAPGASGTVPLTFDYAYNDANQRTKNTLTDGSYWEYQYDELGQVTNGVKRFADGTLVPGQQFGYLFDDIGNREQTTAGGDQNGANRRQASYTVNTLNQITSREYPGTNDVIGVALVTNAVTVNGQTAWRKGEYFWGTVKTNNVDSAQWLGVTVAGGGTTNTGSLYLPQTPEPFSYDADGNLTNDGRWSYVWDAENRLVQMTVNTNVGPQYQLTFAYDAKGRRIQKVVATNDGSAYVPQSSTRYVYDGWNLVAELTPDDTAVRTYVWGNDLSGSLQGAGGVGGLLAVSYYGTSTTNCFPAFDGNGNVMALVNAADGTVVANYAYGPFGETVQQTGVMARNNPFRFSTKYQDDESDLLYYGYRYYKQSTGSWPSRDPKDELGFENLRRPRVSLAGKNDFITLLQGFNPYCVMDNQAISAIDFLGLDKKVLEHLLIYRDSTVSVGFDPLKNVTGLIKILKSIYDSIDSAKGLIGEETSRKELYITVPDNYVSTLEVSYHFQSPPWGLNYPSGWPNGMSLLNIDIVVHFYLDYHYTWDCPKNRPCPPGIRCF